MRRVEKIVRVLYPQVIIAGCIHNHLVALLERIHYVENEATWNIKPFYICVGARARHNTETAGRIIIPLEWEATASNRREP